MTERQGILLVDKPAGMTSHDVVSRVRRALKTRRVGHAGTLDPDATGLLVLCVGDALRLLEYVGADEKAYTGVAVFGVATDTDDASGEPVQRASASHLTLEDVRAAAARLTGEIDQRVPAYSAVHIGGRRAYELARAGEAPEMPVRKVHIHQLAVTRFEPGEVARAEFTVVCSKGTYVRALCRDWGQVLGLPAHMGGLRRTQVGPFRLEQAVTLEAIERAPDPGVYLLPSRMAVVQLHQVTADDASLRKLAQGQPVPLALFSASPGVKAASEAPVIVLTPDGEVAAVAERVLRGTTHWLRPKKVLWKRDAGQKSGSGGEKRVHSDAGDRS